MPEKLTSTEMYEWEDMVDELDVRVLLTWADKMAALEADNTALREKYMNAVIDNAEVAYINADYLVELVDLRKRVEGLESALEEIAQWADAYPLAIFPEPDFEKAQELLKAGGMTLDAISASNMRHVVEGVGKIADEALAEEKEHDS